MPGKKGRSKNQKEPKYDEEKPVNVAFVLCHPMDTTLAPVSKELPPCLFPLCNTPVLLYILNWLSINGIDKIYVICQSSHEKPIQNYIKQCEERMLMESIELIPVMDPIYSIGDSIRWIYASNRIDLNFTNGIIVPGTLVTNVPLKNILAEHEECVKKEKKEKLELILTTIFTQASSNGYSAIVDDDGRILQLCIPPEINVGNSQPPLQVEPSLFKKRTSVHVKSGLNDSQIYICSPDLFSNFSSTDNFEWHSVTKDCIPSIIWDVEIRMQSVHAAILPESYASNVNDLPNYIASSLAVIRRWLYPVTLEMNLFAPSEASSLLFADIFDDDEEEDNDENNDGDKTTNADANNDSSSCLTNAINKEEVTAYRLERDLVYLYENVFPSLSAHIGHSVVIGSGSEIEENCVIQNSVIGSKCKIMKGAVIKNCIIWDRVTIEEGVHIDNSLIASDVHIKKGIKINFGCILSFNTIDSIDLPPCRRLSGDFNNDHEREVSFRTDVAPQWLKDYIKNRKPLPEGNDNDYFEYTPRPEAEFPLLRLWYQLSPDTFPIDISQIEIDYKETGPRNQRNDNEEEEYMDSDGSDFITLNHDFQKEASKILDGLISNGSDFDQIQSEFVVFKNSKYADPLNCAASIAISIIDNWPNDFHAGFNVLGKLLCSFFSDIETQEDFLFWWQGHCAKSQQRTSIFCEGLKLLIDNGAISHEALDSWESQQEDSNEAQLRLFNKYKSMENA